MKALLRSKLSRTITDQKKPHPPFYLARAKILSALGTLITPFLITFAKLRKTFRDVRVIRL